MNFNDFTCQQLFLQLVRMFSPEIRCDALNLIGLLSIVYSHYSVRMENDA